MTRPSARPVVVAIDGPAASGKGTLARRLAAALGLPYLDTGLLYRAVARRVLDAGAGAGAGETDALREARTLRPEDLARDDLRVPAVDREASRVAAFPSVRDALLDAQRRFAASRGGVLDGRDIGTVVFPDATAKLFVTASAVERARRRLNQRGEPPNAAALARERAAIEARDAADRSRPVAPLAAAPDAVTLDTTALDPDAAFRAALLIVRERLGKARPMPLDKDRAPGF